MDQRQSYVRVSKQLLQNSYNATHLRRVKKAKKARKKLRTTAGRLIRELPEATLDSYKQYVQLCRKMITQKRKDKSKVYSLHKPPAACIAKGKAHKPYEFGNKIGLLVHGSQKIILAVEAFMGNPHDRWEKTSQPKSSMTGAGVAKRPYRVLKLRPLQNLNKVIRITRSDACGAFFVAELVLRPLSDT